MLVSRDLAGAETSPQQLIGELTAAKERANWLLVGAHEEAYAGGANYESSCLQARPQAERARRQQSPLRLGPPRLTKRQMQVLRSMTPAVQLARC